MDQFDEYLKERAKAEPFPLPEDYADRVFQTCAELKEDPVHRRKFRPWGTCIAAMLALSVVLNVSPTTAAALEQIPLLGSIVELVTIRRYVYEDSWRSANVETPVLDGSQGAQSVNLEIQAYTDQLIAQFQRDCEELGENYMSLDVTSSVVTNTDTWFTLRVDATRTQASSYEFSKFYHIDKTNDTVVELRDLFRPEVDYISALSTEVLRQMETLGREEQTYFPEEFTTIDSDQNFYWNDTGELVLVFNEYTVAAGCEGMPEFVIPAEVYSELLQ